MRKEKKRKFIKLNRKTHVDIREENHSNSSR